MTAFLLLLNALSVVVQGSTTTSPDESRIRQILIEEESAWNRGNAKDYAAHFEENGGFTNVAGTVIFGRQGFEARHGQLFATAFKDTHISFTVRNIRFVRPDVAIVDVDTAMTGYKALPPGVRAAPDGTVQTRLQQVMVKERGDWWIASYHNVDVKTP